MRIKELQQELRKKKIDFSLFYNSDSTKSDPNMFYFSGYNGLGSLIVPKNHRPFLIAPEMEFQRAKKSLIKRVYSMEKKKFFESISTIIKKNKIKYKKIAIDKNSFNLNSYKYFILQDVIRGY